MIIKNGVGDGTLARVFSNHHLGVKSIGETTIGYKSRVEQLAFSIGCPMAYSVTTSETTLMVWHNNESEKSFVLSGLYISHNGGDSTGTKVVYGRMYKGASSPTTGILGGQAYQFGNLNFGSSKITYMQSYLWDGSTGTGLSGGANGTMGLLQMFGKGLTHVDLSGSIVISPGQFVRVTMQGEETTKVLVSISGFACDPDSM